MPGEGRIGPGGDGNDEAGEQRQDDDAARQTPQSAGKLGLAAEVGQQPRAQPTGSRIVRPIVLPMASSSFCSRIAATLTSMTSENCLARSSIGSSACIGAAPTPSASPRRI